MCIIWWYKVNAQSKYSKWLFYFNLGAREGNICWKSIMFDNTYRGHAWNIYNDQWEVSQARMPATDLSIASTSGYI